MYAHTKNFTEEYNALFDDFKTEILLKAKNSTPAPEDFFRNIPCLFTPLAGKKYTQTPLRVAFIGKETLYWGKGGKSLSNQLKEDWTSCIPTDFFHNHEFLTYKNKTGKKGRMTLGCFWGFVLKMLAEIHEIPDWKLLRKYPSGYSDILKSFLWGNVHSIETPDSRAIKDLKGRDEISVEAHNLALSASHRFNSYQFIQKYFSPNITIITDKSHTEKKYIQEHFFRGVSLSKIQGDTQNIPSIGTIDTYEVKNSESYIFHIWHPSYIFRKGKNRLIEEYTRKINNQVRSLFRNKF